MTQHPPITFYKGRTIGIVILIALQLLIGIIHVFSGLWLLTSEISLGIFNLQSPDSVAYPIYTLVFGFLVLLFAALMWYNNRAGWIGTVAVLLFVIAADGLTLLNLPSVPGIPKFPALTEILYSLVIVIYLLQSDVRRKYLL
jgi:hypothetical protein